jgi:peptide/nickel transport system substrate-binding protein
MKRTFTIILILLLALAGLAVAQKRGGTLVAAWMQEPVGLDPHITSAMSSYQVFENVLDTLVTLDEEQNIVPSLAHDWVVSDDGRTVTFFLRDGLRFSNGKEVLAEHFVTVYERLLDPETGSGNAPRLAGVASVTAPDATTVVFELDAPNAVLMVNLAFKALGLFDPAGIADGTVGTRPVGTGPFMITDFQPGTRLLLERNPHYWQEGLPYLDAVDIRIIGDETVRRSALVTGDIDWAFAVPPQAIEELDARDDVVIDAVPAGAYYYLGVNMREGPLADVRVRQAISFAVNRDNIIAAAEFGNAALTQDPVPSAYGWSFDYAPYSYDPERARQLLADAGYANGFEIEIMPTTFLPETIRAAQVVQSDLAAVNIRSTIRTLEWAEWLQEQGDGNYDTFVCSWNGLIDPFDFYHLQHRTGEVFNFTGYSNPTVDQLLDQGVQEMDPDARRAIYEEVNRAIVDEAAYIYFYNLLQVHAYRADVKGFSTRGDQAVRFLTTWLDR